VREITEIAALTDDKLRGWCCTGALVRDLAADWLALRAKLAEAEAEREVRIQHQTAMADQLDLTTGRLLFLADWFSDGDDIVILHDHPEAGDHEHIRWQTVKLDGKPVRALLVMDGYSDPEEDRNESLTAALDAAMAPTPECAP
jgi:hypothetical protein